MDTGRKGMSRIVIKHNVTDDTVENDIIESSKDHGNFEFKPGHLQAHIDRCKKPSVMSVTLSTDSMKPLFYHYEHINNN